MPPKRIRTVSGTCHTCKIRRVLCDLSKPRCGKCIAAGLTCEYGTQYKWTGVAARGKFAKLSVPVSQQDESLTTESQDETVDENDDNDSSRRNSQLTIDSLSSSRETSPGTSTSDSTITLVLPQSLTPGAWQRLYFQHSFLPLFSLNDPGNAVQLDLSALGDVGLQTVHAIASAHREVTSGSSSGGRLLESSTDRLAAIQSFRRTLSGLESTSAPVLFAANVLFCILDGMVRPHEDTRATFWHFQGGRAILQTGRNAAVIYAQKKGLLSVLTSVFAMIDLTSSVLSGEASPFFDRDWWMANGDRDAWWTGLSEDERLVGILAAMAELAAFGHLAKGGAPPLPLEHLSALKGVLDRLAPSTSTQEIKTEEEEDDEATAFCTAYISAAYLYLYRVLCGLERSHAHVQRHVAQGVAAIEKAERLGQLSHCLLFPMMVIGCHCLRQDEQKVILASVHSSARYLSFGSITVLDEILRSTWRTEDDFDWWSKFHTIAWKAFIF